MDALLPILLLVAGVLAGLFLRDKQAKKKEVKAKVEEAQKVEQEGEIDATLKFKDRVKAAQDAVDAAIAARPVTGDAAADLADRIERRRVRRERRARQRKGSDNPTDWG